MRIDVNVLKNFIQKATMDQNLFEAGLHFDNEGLVIRGMRSNIAGAFSSLRKEAFRDYDAHDGVVGLNDVKLFTKILKTFNGVVHLTVKDNMMHVHNNDGRTASLPIVTNTEFIDGYTAEDMDVLQDFDGGVDVELDVLQQAMNNVSIVDGYELGFNIESNELTLTAESDKDVKIVEKVACDYKDCQGTYGEYLFDCVNALDSDDRVTMHFLEARAGPIMLTVRKNEEKTPYKIRFIVAPRVDEEEQGDDDEESSN